MVNLIRIRTRLPMNGHVFTCSLGHCNWISVATVNGKTTATMDANNMQEAGYNHLYLARKFSKDDRFEDEPDSPT